MMSRRKFMGSSVAAGAAFSIVPSYVLGGPGKTPPSEKLNIAVIGAGGKGHSNTQACGHENIVALCDVDQEKAERTFVAFPKAKRYKDFRRMLDKMDKDIDAVIVATPDHTHAVAALKAIRMGKHVFVQKPLTHTVQEARMLTEAAREMGVATQMGNQGHAKEDCRFTKEWIADGAIGDVREVHCWTNRPVWPQGMLKPKGRTKIPKTLDWDLWLGPARHRPYNSGYLPFNWRGWFDFGCGALGDMACHVMDSAFWALDLKYPTSVVASIAELAQFESKYNKVENNVTYPNASIVHYTFPARGNMPELKLHWYDGGLHPERPDEMDPRSTWEKSGTIFVGDKGKIMCGEYGNNPRIIPRAKMRAYKRPAKTLKRIGVGIEQNWIDACKGGEPACSNFEYSGPFTETVVMGNLAIRMPDQKLMWDGANMKVTNNDAANEFVGKTYRKGWEI